MVRLKNRFLNYKVMILTGLISLSFLLRFFNAPPAIIYPDSCMYLSFAKSMLRGLFSFDFRNGDEIIMPPFYSVSGAVLSFFTGDIELSALLVSAVAGALLIIPVFYLTRAIYNERAAWICAVFIFLNPSLIRWSGVILTESLFITLFLSAIAFGWYGIEGRRNILLFLSGVFIGLSYMTRIIGLVALPALVLYIVYYTVMSRRVGSSKLFKDMLTPVIILSFGFILVTGVYLVKLHSFYGYWTLSGSYGSIKGTITFEGSDTLSGWEKLSSQKTEESFIDAVSKKVIINVQNYLSALLKMLILTIILIVAGLFPSRKVIYLVFFTLFYFLALLVQPLSPLVEERVRYLSPILPLLMMVASGGIVHIYDLLKGKAIRYAVIPVAAGIILISWIPQLGLFPLNLNKSWTKKEAFIDTEKEVGGWMKENLPHPARVMARKPYIPYYADATWFLTPPTYNAVIEFADQNGIDYLVIDRKYDYYLRPELRFLFQTEQVPADLKLIYGTRNPRTGELVTGVYEIKG